MVTTVHHRLLLLLLLEAIIAAQLSPWAWQPCGTPVVGGGDLPDSPPTPTTGVPQRCHCVCLEGGEGGKGGILAPAPGSLAVPLVA